MTRPETRDTQGTIYCLRENRKSKNCHVFEGMRHEDESCSYQLRSLCGKMEFNQGGSSFPFQFQAKYMKRKAKYCPQCLLLLTMLSTDRIK